MSPPGVTMKWCFRNSCPKERESSAGSTLTISLLDHNVSKLRVVSSACLQKLIKSSENTESIHISNVLWVPMMLCSLGPFPPAEHTSMICCHMGPPHLPKETRAQAIYICNWVESNCAGRPRVQVRVCVCACVCACTCVFVLFFCVNTQMSLKK